MDDLYSFGKTKYVQADPIQRSIFRIVANVLLVLYTLLKCTVLGILLALKSLLFFIIPQFPKDVQYQVALVTGAANGLGRAIAIELAKCGCNIAVCDVDMVGACDTVEEIHLLGVKAFPYEVDVSNYEEIVALKEKIKDDLGDVDILVNNAGLLPKISLMEGNPEDILRIFKVNLISHFWTIRVFLPTMISNGRGHIVATCSVLGLESSCRAISYCSTKFGIRALMDGLYDKFHIDKLNINVTTVFPPLMNTRKEFIDQFISHGGLNPLADLSYCTPKQVAIATVDGILKNKQYVCIPWITKYLLTWIQLLPEEVTNLVRNSFKPDISPGFYESSQKTTTVPNQEPTTVPNQEPTTIPYMNGTKSM